MQSVTRVDHQENGTHKFLKDHLEEEIIDAILIYEFLRGVRLVHQSFEGSMGRGKAIWRIAALDSMAVSKVDYGGIPVGVD